jgi:Glycosyl hydrolases family 38 N-terminal domain
MIFCLANYAQYLVGIRHFNNCYLKSNSFEGIPLYCHWHQRWIFDMIASLRLDELPFAPFTSLLAMRPVSLEPFRLRRACIYTSVVVLCFWRGNFCWGREEDASRTFPWLSEVRKFAAEDDPRTLNVHVVPHTHDDVGWLKTVDQYYGGLNNSIQQADVRSIITTVVQSLLNNPSRTFSYVEQKFFSMWWSEQSDAIKDKVRYLVANQQLVFLNGGWCMHDEASTHFVSMIDQTTLGHSFLLRELGVVPRVAWQLDPFGHSATQASLLTSRAGMDALYFGRIDYQDLALRKLTRECEGLWNASSSLDDTTVFWGLTGSYNGNYGAPPGFWYDIHTGDKSLVDADSEYVKGKIHTLLEFLRIQSDQTKGNHIMLTMGSDFQVRYC